jgi:hypothetical protein
VKVCRWARAESGPGHHTASIVPGGRSLGTTTEHEYTRPVSFPHGPAGLLITSTPPVTLPLRI